MIKRKKLRIVLVATTVLMSVVSVSASEFTSGDEDAVMENAKAQDMTDEGNLFDDGAAFIEREDVDFTFEDAVSEQTVSAEDVPIDEEHFPNLEFREFLFDSRRDKNQNGILESGEITEIKSIRPEDYADYGVYNGVKYSPSFTKSSMQGIEYLTAVEKLNLMMMGEPGPLETADDLIIDLSTLPLLKELKVYSYSYEEAGFSQKKSTPTVLNLSTSTRLTKLQVLCDIREILLPEDCNIEEYRISCWTTPDDGDNHFHGSNDQYLIQLITKMPRLEKIEIHGSSKVILNTRNNPHLRSIDIDHEGAYNDVWLDFSNNRELETLHIENLRWLMKGENQTYELDLSNCPSLREVDIFLDSFAMYDFGDCHPERVHVTQSESVKNGTGGYFDLNSMIKWDSSRVASVSKEFVIKDDRLYPTILDNPSKQELDSTITDGHIKYYLNDDRTVTADMNFSIYEIPNPDMVTGLKVSKRTETSLTCQWNPVKRAHNGYTIYVQDALTEKTVKRVSVGKDVTSKTITGLQVGQRYRVIVRAYRTYKKKNYYSPYYKGTAVCYTLPKTPSPKVSLRSDRRVKLTWKASPAAYRQGNSQYVIYYRNAKSKHYQRLTQLPDKKESYTTKALKKGNTYYFRIRSIISDKDGKYKTYGDFSKTVKVTIK